MNSAEPSHSAERRLAGSGGIVPLAIVICCAVIGLDQVLNTTPATLSASPFPQLVHWAGNVVLAVPFAAVALWTGGWIGGRLGISLEGASGVFAQASVIVLVLAVLLVPAWFAHYAVDSLASTSGVAAQAAAIPAGHADHVHGGPAPAVVSWVGNGVLYVLMSIPLAAAAVCMSQRVANRLSTRLTGETDIVVRAVVTVGAVALGLTLGWFLQVVASQAEGLLTYTSGLQAVHAHHLGHAHLSSVTEVVVQLPFGYQLAHAAQDGLAVQAIGLPVTFAGLLWLTRRLRGAGETANSISQVRT